MKVKALTALGVYGDGGGLYFQVTPPAGRSWLFRSKRDGRTRWAGLGSYPAVSLAEAREAAAKARKMLATGGDPIEAKRTERAEAAARADRRFSAVTGMYLAAHEAEWRNPKHRQQWRNTLATYAFPKLGEMPVASITTGDVLAVLRPIWQDKPETASRVRGRIESVLAYSKAMKLRAGENPAAWKDNLDHLLPATGKIARVEHPAALPWRYMGAFMAELAKHEGVGALALRFAILTAARSGEVRGARWSEIDMEAGIWTIPAERMKAGREHRVPLSDPALDVLHEMRAQRHHDDDVIFPGMRPGKPLSDMSLTAVLRRMGRGELTAHGFRSAFRDWASEATAYPREVAEAALAHVVRDKVEAAYARGDMLDRRRRLMAEWATFCMRPAPAGEVVPLRAAG